MPQYSRRLRDELTQVYQGLTLGCIHIGVHSVEHDVERLSTAIDDAWRRWPHAHKFPALSRSAVPVGDHVWNEMSRFGRRAGPDQHAYWRPDHARGRLLAVRTQAKPPVEELLETIGEVGGHAWDGLAKIFVRSLEPPETPDHSSTGHLCKP